MMTATQVFGKRAGQYAAEFARKRHKAPKGRIDVQFPVLKQGKETDARERDRLVRLEQTVKQSMSKYVNVVRTKSGLDSCNQILLDADGRLLSMEGAHRANYLHYSKVRNMLDVALRIVASALRRGTCGPHFLADVEDSQPI